MSASIAIVYGIFSYTIFLGSLVYAFGFMANLWVPWPMDAVPRAAPARALLINACLVALVATHHCLLKRPLARHWFLRRLPLHLEHKSCFLVSGLLLVLLVWAWQPVGRIAWSVDSPVTQILIWMGFTAGCVIVLASAVFLRRLARDQLGAAWQGIWRASLRRTPRKAPGFPGNPLYTGWLLVFWCVPTMTVSHLAMSVIASVFVLLAFAQERRLSHTGRRRYVGPGTPRHAKENRTD